MKEGVCVQTTGDARATLHAAFLRVLLGAPPPPLPPGTAPFTPAPASHGGHDRVSPATESQLTARERAFLASLAFT
jgi:hypothetical protein